MKLSRVLFEKPIINPATPDGLHRQVFDAEQGYTLERDTCGVIHVSHSGRTVSTTFDACWVEFAPLPALGPSEPPKSTAGRRRAGKEDA